MVKKSEPTLADLHAQAREAAREYARREQPLLEDCLAVMTDASFIERANAAMSDLPFDSPARRCVESVLNLMSSQTTSLRHYIARNSEIIND